MENFRTCLPPPRASQHIYRIDLYYEHNCDLDHPHRARIEASGFARVDIPFEIGDQEPNENQDFVEEKIQIGMKLEIWTKSRAQISNF